MNLPITINGVDCSDILEYTTRSETFRKVSGQNAGTAINGDAIYDTVSTKYDLSCTTKPCRTWQLRQLHDLLMLTPVEVEYYSFWRDEIVIQQMNCENAEALLGMIKYGNDIIIKNVPIELVAK